jgi:hypothetical protein
MTNSPSAPRGDPAAPFLTFLAAGVVMVVAVLAYLTFEEGKPRRAEVLADNLPARIAPAPPTSPNPQRLPMPAPGGPR